jgi:predicted nucleotidyltransferase
VKIDDSKLKDVVSELEQFSPRSIFIYGSRGRGDFTKDSDYEVGIVFNQVAYVERAKIHAVITDSLVKVYPFMWEELTSGKLDFLFQKSMYLRELKLGAKVLYGDDILSVIPEVPITSLDLIQRIRFDIGMALAALLSYRSGDIDTAMEEFTKSCLYGVRSLVILQARTFPVGYENIYAASSELIDDEDCKKVIEAAMAYRRSVSIPKIDLMYENISLLDSYIEPKILLEFRNNGDTKLV